MALKKLLKSILNVNCIKIINAEFDHVSSSLYIRVEITKDKDPVVQSVAESATDMILLLNTGLGEL